MSSKIVMTSLSPESSSSLPKYVGNALAPASQVQHAWPHPSRLGKYLSMALTFHPSRQKWRDAFERETQHRLRTWRQFSADLQARPLLQQSDVILQEGLHFNSFPTNYRGKCALYLHGVLTMVLDNQRFDCSMWRPPKHEIEPWLDAEKQVLGRADRIFIGSKFLGDILEHRYGVARAKISFVGTGKPPLDEAFAAQPKYSASNKILFVGKGFEMKGGEVLLRAFSDVVAEIPSARLQIVGPRKIRVPLHPNVEFLGRIHDRQRLARLYREAAVYAMPSLHESFGFVFLEAMACGLPCVGSNIFAMPEIIEHGRTGLIVEAGNHEQLAQALLRLLRNPEEAAKMGAAGRERVKSEFNWESVGAKIASELGIARAQS